MEVELYGNPWSPKKHEDYPKDWVPPVGFLLTQHCNRKDLSTYDIGAIDEALHLQVERIIEYWSRFSHFQEEMRAALATDAADEESYQKLCSAFIGEYKHYDPVKLLVSTAPQGLEFEYWQAFVQGVSSQLVQNQGFFLFSQERAEKVLYKYKTVPTIDRAKAIGLVEGCKLYNEGINLALSDLKWTKDGMTHLLEGLNEVSVHCLDLRDAQIDPSPRNLNALNALLENNQNCALYLPSSLKGKLSNDRRIEFV